MFAAFIKWFTDRWPFNAVIEWSLEEEIPGGDSFWYSFGATTLFVFVIQVVTGIWQLFFYVPTVDHAYQSVSYLRYQVPFGWFIHGLHYWGSNAFIVIVFVHLLRVFVWGAYKRPRQLTWLVGVMLLFLVLALSFTGALLPWDEVGYWAAEVGTSIAGTVPAIGFFIKEFMRGGASMDQMTLSRFFIAHVAILPGILAALIAFHVVAFRQFRSVGPWKEEKRKKTGYFWPQQVLKDLIVISCLFVGLVALSAFWPAQVSGPADDLDNIITPKPEWQFLFLYQFLKLFKGRMEPLGTVGVPLAVFLILFLLPFYDRNEKRSPLHRPIAMLGCIALIVWFLVYTVLGYYSKPGASLSQQVTVSAQASESVKEGAKLFSSQGCVACHAVHGEGGNIGPNLSNIGGQGLTDQWFTTQIRHPKEHDPSTAMPAFDSLTDQQVKHLVDFLQSLGGTPSKSEQSQSLPVLSAPPKSPNEPNKPPQKTQASQSSLISQGKSLFSLQGCAGCHTVNGKGGSLGPDLSDVGSRGFSEQWLLTQLEDPKKHDADTLMPSFSSLSSQKLDSLVAYLESLKSSSEQAKPSTPFSGPSTSQPPSPPAAKPAPPTGPNSTSVESTAPGPAAYLVGNPPHGKLLYNKHCSDCHGKDGKGGVSNPGSDTGRIPALNPISKKLFSENPETFAQNIDRYIQHGVRPEGPAPEKTMPAFGDGLKLTQQMICEIEAYILQLNNVNRAKIMHPGFEPYVFFAITLGGYALTVFIVVLLWVPAKEGRGLEPAQIPENREEREETPMPGPDQGEPTPEEDRKPHPTSSAAFVIIVIVVIAIIATMLLLIFSSFVTTKPIPTITAQHIAPKKQQPAGPAEEKPAELRFSPPSPEDAPPEIRPAILRGEAILRHTHKTLISHTGNELDCTHCHFEAGLTEKALSLVGVWAVYPKYDKAAKRPIDLAMKTNDCFIRYLNAPPLPPDSNDILDILAYYRYISSGIPVDANVPWLGLEPIKLRQKPDVAKGKDVFTKCMPCHGKEGQGLLPSGAPPLWGKGAFPAGPGMGKEDLLAAFVHKLMPKNDPNLTVTQAADVAAFVLSHPRPQQKQESQE